MVTKILESKVKDLGGFSVIRAIPLVGCKSIGPFVFWDYLPPVEIPPGPGMEVPPHPHIGLSTLSYLFEGRVVHRDNLGYTQEIHPGAVNWMTAGSGIVHSERSHADDIVKHRRLHMLQSWIALPDGQEEVEPSFEHHPAHTLPVMNRGGAEIRLVAGEAFGEQSPVRVYSPLYYLDIKLEPGALFTFDPSTIGPEMRSAVWPISGKISSPGEKQAISASQNPLLRVYDDGAPVEVTAADKDTQAHFILFGGRPVGRRIVWWNYVARNAERLEQAKASWREMKWGSVPGDNEFIPMPEQ